MDITDITDICELADEISILNILKQRFQMNEIYVSISMKQSNRFFA